MTDIKTNAIPHRLKNVNKEHPYVSGARDIYDDVKGKSQEQVNKDVDDAILAEKNRAEAVEALHQNEINALDNQNYYTVEATQADTTIASVMARAGVVPQVDTVYRVGKWDGTQYDVTVYSEYAYNIIEGSGEWKLLDVKSYGIDDVPTAGSENLVKSGGIYPIKRHLDFHLEQTENIFTIEGQVEGVIDPSGNILISAQLPGVYTTDFIPVEANTEYMISVDGARRIQQVVGFYNGTSFISRVIGDSTATFTTPLDCTHVRVSSEYKAGKVGFAEKMSITKGNTYPYIPSKRLDDVEVDGIRELDFRVLKLSGCIDKYAISRIIINSSNVWAIMNYTKAFIIPVNAGDNLYLYNGNSRNTIFAFLKDNYTTNGASPAFDYKYIEVEDPDTGEITTEIETDEHGNPIVDTRRTLIAGSFFAGKIPPQTKYLYLLAVGVLNSQPIYALPTVVKIGNIVYNNVTEEQDNNIEEYTTLFFDDFNEPLSNIWTLHTVEPNPTGAGNKYNSRFKTTSDNAYTKDSCLVMKCSKSATAEDGKYTYKEYDAEAQDVIEKVGDVQYIASYISSCDKLAITKGRVSARIKFSKDITDGMFPGGFWTFGQNNTWPYAHEMDIIESAASVSSVDKTASDGTFIPKGSHCSEISCRLHCRTANVEDLYKATMQKIAWAIYNQGVFDYEKVFINKLDVTQWHTYTAEWDEESITYFIDDKLIISYSAQELGAIDANGNIGFFYPQDLRFNLKAFSTSVGNDGYMFVDWVKAEVKDLTPCISITQEDINLNVNSSVYLNPTFNSGCSNRAFSVYVEDSDIVRYDKYLNDKSQMMAHRLVGVSAGSTNVTITSADGGASCTFVVIVL